AAHLAVLVDHTVTWDHNGDAVLAIGSTDGPAGAGLPNRLSQAFIGLGLPVRNLQQAFPDRFLKGSSLKRDGSAKFSQLAGEILRQFRLQLVQKLVLAGNDRATKSIPQLGQLFLQPLRIGKFEQTDSV